MMKKKLCIYCLGFALFSAKRTYRCGMKVLFLTLLLLFTTLSQFYSKEGEVSKGGNLSWKDRLNADNPGLDVFDPSVAFKKFSSLQSIGTEELEEIKSYIGQVAFYNTPHYWAVGNYHQEGHNREEYMVTPIHFKNFTIFMVEKYYMTREYVWYVCYDFVVYNHPGSTFYYSETIESCNTSKKFFGKGYPTTIITGLYTYPSEAPDTSPAPSGEVLYPQYVLKSDSQTGTFEIVQNDGKEYTLKNDLKRTWGWWYGYVNDNRVRVRNSPGLNGDILMVVDKGIEVQVRERSAEPETIDGESWYWYKIHGDMIDGWIYGKYLERINSYL